MSSRLILVIDDDPEDILVLQESLMQTALDFTLKTIHKGKEAFTYLQELAHVSPRSYPDLIILDLHIPEMEGTTLLQKIRKERHLLKIPIIAYTGIDDQNQINTCYAFGVNCCIRKPKTIEESNKLAEAIENFWFSTIRLPSDSYSYRRTP